jgi:hypothetical protein
MTVIGISNPKRPGMDFINPTGGFVSDAIIIQPFDSLSDAKFWLWSNEPNLGLHLDDVLTFVQV